ncbi:MAG: DNA pilot protein [Microviridae sp.]|nr:MAG: DNA pilot protein [Microviridae sp.]
MEPNAIASVAASSVPTNQQLASGLGTMFTNYMSQKYATAMYNRTRKDNLEFWNMQNQYNSPAAQMQRFKDAGLNPNLIYGQGSNGNSNSIPTPDVQSVNFREPRIEGGHPDVMSALLAQADLRIKNAQVSNIEAQNDVIRNQAILQRQQLDTGAFDLQFKADTRETDADMKRERLRQVQTQTNLALNQDAREVAKTSTSIAEALERMTTLREQRKSLPLDRERLRNSIELMKRDGTLKDIEIELRRNNINPNDPIWAKYIGLWLGRIFEEDGSMKPIDGFSIWKSVFGSH